MVMLGPGIFINPMWTHVAWGIVTAFLRVGILVVLFVGLNRKPERTHKMMGL